MSLDLAFHSAETAAAFEQQHHAAAGDDEVFSDSNMDTDEAGDTEIDEAD